MPPSIPLHVLLLITHSLSVVLSVVSAIVPGQLDVIGEAECHYAILEVLVDVGALICGGIREILSHQISAI